LSHTHKGKTTTTNLDTGIGKDFLSRILKAQEIRIRIDKLGPLVGAPWASAQCLCVLPEGPFRVGLKSLVLAIEVLLGVCWTEAEDQAEATGLEVGHLSSTRFPMRILGPRWSHPSCLGLVCCVPWRGSCLDNAGP
jgi:hypothetical protein